MMVRSSHRAGLIYPRDDRRYFITAIVGGAATLGTMAASGAILGAGIGAIADPRNPLEGALLGGALGGVGGAGGFELGFGGDAAAGAASDAAASTTTTSALGGTDAAASSLAPDIMDSTQAALGGAGSAAGTSAGSLSLGGAGASATGLPAASDLASSSGLSLGSAGNLGGVAAASPAGSLYIDPLAGGAAADSSTAAALGKAGLLGSIPKSSLALGALAAGAQMLGGRMTPKAPAIPTPNPTALNPYYDRPLSAPVQPRIPAPMQVAPVPPPPGVAPVLPTPPSGASPSAQPSPPGSPWGYNYGVVPFADPWDYNRNSVPFPGAAMADGGYLGIDGGGHAFDSAHGRYVQGPGDGQSDSIPARLSDGEFVLDAHDVSTIGGGSNVAGARKLEHFRTQLHKDAGHTKKFLPKGLGDGALNALARGARR